MTLSGESTPTISPPILDRFTPRAVETIRRAIDDAAGNEVFFLGTLDGTGRIDDVDVLSRGHAEAVPALVDRFFAGAVAIHNHPSGDLTPSDADLEIASLLSGMGVGFSIVDNGVNRDYQVVTPFIPRKTEDLDLEEVVTFFAPGGGLSAVCPGYEARDEQAVMARTVAEAFNGERIALIEAGTGTGKSFAYLYPSILWGVRNRRRVVVSTNTINLQEQLLTKDLPLLRKASKIPFRSVLVKGRGNYLCRRKLFQVMESPLLFSDERTPELEAIAAWSERTSDGSRSDLSFVPSHDTWEEVACEADQCLRVRCRFHSDCFYYAARRHAASADILVINHALLVTDLALKGEQDQGTIPAFDRVIIDEAHNLEEAATRHLALQISHRIVERTVERLRQQRRGGLLDQFLRRAGEILADHEEHLYGHFAMLFEEEIHPRLAGVMEQSARCFDLIGTALVSHGERGGEGAMVRVTDEFRLLPAWEETTAALRSLSDSMEQCLFSLERFEMLAGELGEESRRELEGVCTDISGVVERIRDLVRRCDLFVADGDDRCRWYEIRDGRHGRVIRLFSAPVVVDGILSRILFGRMKSAVLTSATLTVGGRFDYLAQRTGVIHADPEKVTTLVLPSPFDYTRQTLVCLPDDLPEPGSEKYRDMMATSVLEAVQISGGRAFVLFTSYELLRFVHGKLHAAGGFTLLKQGEAERHQLLERFRTARRGVLLGTDSFWEGVDVRGEALELVIITRLPFRVPTEPIQQARCEYLQKQGRDPFKELTIPQAVIKFRQGVGRLIRSRWDRGGILVLDSRIISRWYGRSFLQGLPSGRVIRGRWEEVREGLAKFFC